MFDEIARTIKRTRKQMEGNLPLLRDEIKDIIRRNSQPVARIEEILDILLDYSQLGVGEAEFKELNSYYASFNPENAEFYADSYNELSSDLP